jgi:hypothetical protein
VIPSDLLPWDDGLQEPIDDLRQGIREVEDDSKQPADGVQSSTETSSVDRRLRELEEELNEDWP